MLDSSITIDNFDKLHLRIRILGYPANGESIMISLLDEDRELHNVFIDNYEVNGYQYWITNLPKETRINAFIWTHPDEDHSLGVDNLLSKFDPEKKAQIYLPTSLTKKILEDNKKVVALPCYSFLQDNYNQRRIYQWNEVSLTEGEGMRYLYQRKIINRKDQSSITFRMGFMLPIGAIVNRRVDKSHMNSGEMNDLSLFTVIELNSARYLFTGDLSKISIQFLEDEFLSNCRFIKIPHHGSNDPIKLVDKIQQIPYHKPVSVTTIFGTTNPDENVLNKYAEKCEVVYSTERGDKQYGMVEINYSVKDINLKTITLAGNAKLVRPQ